VADDLRAGYKRRFEDTLEPERYEIISLLEDLTPDRRAFLKAFGGGVCFLVTVRAQERDVPVRVHLAADGTARAFTGKMEMGQGARTLLTQAFAEELGLSVDRVHLVMGDTTLCPDDGGTWGSLTTPQTVPVIRKAAAAVRAATTGAEPPLTAPAAWRTLGQSVPQVESRAIVTGAKVYPSDVRVDAMRHAVVVRSPHHRATLTSVDATAAERLVGVRIVRDGDLLAAIADDPATARQAASLVRPVWTPDTVTPPAEWAALFKKTAVAPVAQPQARYPPVLVRGDVADALRTATRTRSATYWLDPIAHVPLEPRAAVAVWNGDRVTIHGGVQAPFLVRQEVAQALGIPPSHVRIVVSDAGGAFGGKQRGECEIEAARLTRLAKATVRSAWTTVARLTDRQLAPTGSVDL
jgi:isoquinoline 1-oxidoreductase